MVFAVLKGISQPCVILRLKSAFQTPFLAYSYQTKFCYQLHILKLIRFLLTTRSSHQRCSVMKGILRNFAKFTGKHLCQGLFFNQVVGLGPAALLKKRLWHRCFPVNFAKFLRTPFYRILPDDCF